MTTSAVCVLAVLGVPIAMCDAVAADEDAAKMGSLTTALWPGGAPGALGSGPEDVPTITVFIPELRAEKMPAVVVCPGGGYAGLAPHEAEPVARWLNTIGVAGLVLKYRLGPKYHHPCELNDASRAIRTVRARANEWGIDPAKIGILGFSAGGHLASTAGTHYDAGDPNAEDPIERVSSRPDFMVLVYPVISLKEFGHLGSRNNLLGENPPQELIDLLSNETQVTPDTPPAFLVHGVDDAGVPVENSLMFASALRAAGVPFELHLFEHGPHGFGLGGDDPALSVWPKLCVEWLRVRGVL